MSSYIIKNKISINVTGLFLSLLLISTISEAQFLFFKKKNATQISSTKNQEAEYFFSDGMKEFILENYGKANTSFFKSLDANPTSAATHYMIAQIYNKQRNWYKALDFGQKAIKFNDQNKYYYELVAGIYEQKQDFNEAIKVYQSLLKKYPQFVEYNYSLANFYTNLGKYEEALKSYEKIEKAFGMSDDVTSAKQQLLLKQNKLEEAIKEGKKLIDAYPDDQRILMMQIELLISNEKFSEAENLVSDMLKKDPSNPYATLVLSDISAAKGDTVTSKKYLYQAFGNSDVNIDAKVGIIFSKLRQLPNENLRKQCDELSEILVKTHTNDAKSYAIRGDVLSISSQNKDALSSYLKSIAIDNSQFKVWQQINLIDHELQLFDSMKVHSEKAIEVFPNQSFFWFYNGLAYQFKKDYRKSAVAFEEGKKLSFNDKQMLVQFQTMLGDSYNGSKEYKKSDEAFEEALKIDANNHLVMNNYSYYLSMRKERLEYAKKLSEKVIKEYPDNATYLDTYAWILYVMKDYRAAADIFEKIVEKSDNGTIVEHYGDVLYQLGKKDQALEFWKKAKKLGDSSELIDKKIADNKLYE